MKTQLGTFKNIGQPARLLVFIFFVAAVAIPGWKYQPWTKIDHFWSKATSSKTR